VSRIAGEPLLLGMDLGTSALKVLLVDLEGRVVGRGGAGYPTDRPAPDRAEQDPEAWWLALTTSVGQTLASARAADPGAPDPSRRVAAIGLSGQMHGSVLLGSDLRALGPAVIWPDRRSARQVEGLTAEVGRERVIDIVGGPLATGFQAATARWFRDEEPARWTEMRMIVTPKDALRLRLTGELATDPSDASGTGFLDETTRRWSGEMLAAVGLEQDRLPPLREARASAGRLLPEPAATLGLPDGIPVATGAADTAAGLLGAGVIAPDSFFLSIGTGGQLALPTIERAVDLMGRSHTFCAALAPSAATAGWYRLAATLSAGMALRWLRDEVFALGTADAYDRMVAWAEDVPIGARGLLFLPYLVGERSPHMDPTARGVLLGLTASHGQAELVRAVLEGVALACFDASRGLAEPVALPNRLVLAGGGARSPLWQGIIADVFGTPVQRFEVDERAATGACILAGAAVDLVDPAVASRAWARVSGIVEPDGTHHVRYMELFEMFRDAYTANRAAFTSLRRFEPD
jgi:xylulokinase